MSAIVLIALLYAFITNRPHIVVGELWGVPSLTWFWLAIAVPVIHQTYVWLVWRFELYHNSFTSRLGLKRAFSLYAAGFSLLFGSRLISIIILAVSNQGSSNIPPYIAFFIAAGMTPLAIYLFYSVKKYFSIERAYGIDHFDKTYNTPLVKKGIFRFTDNGMYVYGLMILYLPGLLLLSEAALLAALFNHAYIWVHFYFTERPDMEEIYGK